MARLLAPPGEISTVEETGFYVEVKPGWSLSSLAADLGRIPARGRVSPPLMRAEPRRGSGLTSPSISGFYPIQLMGKGTWDYFIR